METAQVNPVIDPQLVRGPYETNTTNTAQLAAELATPQDTQRLLTDFDTGVTLLRDVGGMITAQRDAILDANQKGTVGAMARTHREILASPVANLHRRVTDGEQDQPIGHNFFVNANGFLEAGLPWARQFDTVLRTEAGYGIGDIARSRDMRAKDRLLAAITENPADEMMATLAVYLAGRSLEGERYQKQYYGDVLHQAKGEAYAATQMIAATTGLRVDMLERAAGQLHRATFGSFDHLQGLVTSDNSGAAGDYQTGSLRVEVQFDGNVQTAQVRGRDNAHHVVAHEIQHAVSAQVGRRCGLRVGNQGIEANEGMTEYITQISLGSPGIRLTTEGTLQVLPGVPYRAPVFAMLALHEQFKAGKNQHFAVLFNAYHGDVRNQAQLEAALDAFYQHDAAVARHLPS